VPATGLPSISTTARPLATTSRGSASVALTPGGLDVERLRPAGFHVDLRPIGIHPDPQVLCLVALSGIDRYFPTPQAQLLSESLGIFKGIRRQVNANPPELEQVAVFAD
jgi:hypothetical protein